MRDQHMGTQPVELFVSDALHLAKVFDPLEGTMGCPVLNHPVRQLRADAWQCFQVRSSRAIQIHASQGIWSAIVGTRRRGRCHRRSNRAI